jgi:hypothetical protein
MEEELQHGPAEGRFLGGLGVTLGATSYKYYKPGHTARRIEF